MAPIACGNSSARNCSWKAVFYAWLVQPKTPPDLILSLSLPGKLGPVTISYPGPHVALDVVTTLRVQAFCMLN
eukprot:4278-Pelagomonas_calceolata.AAC.12